MAKITTSITIDSDVFKRVIDQKKEENRGSFSNMIETMAIRYLNDTRYNNNT